MRSTSVYFFCALPCEAKALINHYKLKKLPHSAFEIFSHNGFYLSISGPGKANMAACLGYTLACFPPDSNPLLFNLGIAGAQQAALGSMFIIDKIHDREQDKNFYPQILDFKSLASCNLTTVSRAESNYAPDQLYDMEGSAFYETATRFTYAELIALVKAVSDNRDHPWQTISAKAVEELMSRQIDALENMVNSYQARAALLAVPQNEHFTKLTHALHFTVSEQQQLKNLLQRWRCLSPNQDFILEAEQKQTARLVLQSLAKQIEELPVNL
jgi:adenosylhomocysteine nucleosidase